MSSTSSIKNINGSNQKNILIGCTGSVASIKIPELVKTILELERFQVKIVVTEHAKHFFKKEDVLEVDLITDKDEWDSWKNRGDPVVHIELAKWADLFLIAPLDANTLGKLASVSAYVIYLVNKICLNETNFCMMLKEAFAYLK